MRIVLVMSLSVALSAQYLAGGINFSSTAIGAGGALSGLGAFGIGKSTGSGSAAGAGAEGGNHNGINLNVSPSGSTFQDTDSEPLSSPEATNGMTLLPGFLLEGLMSRPVYKVPDYRDSSPRTTAGDSGPTETRKRVKRKVKKTHPGPPSPSARIAPKVCWTLSKRCCYEEVNQGYECRDFYTYKYARCHPVIEYAERCTSVQEVPKDHPKPAEYVRYEESIIKNYDANYGPHMEGYPEGGESKYYRSESMPDKPYNVTGEPYSTPAQDQYSVPLSYEAHVQQTTPSDETYHTTTTTISTYKAPKTNVEDKPTAPTTSSGNIYNKTSTKAPSTQSPIPYPAPNEKPSSFWQSPISPNTGSPSSQSPSTAAVPTKKTYTQTSSPPTTSTSASTVTVKQPYTSKPSTATPNPGIPSQQNTQIEYLPVTTRTAAPKGPVSSHADSPDSSSPIGTGQSYRFVER